MNANSVANSKYTYIHDLKYPPQAVDAHHIEVQGRGAKGIVLSILVAVIFSHYGCSVLLKSSSFPLPSLLFGALLMMLFGRKRLVRESVVIMPTLGVQLEKLYKSQPLVWKLLLKYSSGRSEFMVHTSEEKQKWGKVVRCFFPADVILKPVLQECVTPVTCYWNLSLLLRGEEELMLVFKEVRPPLKMLIIIWKALCAVSDNNCPETSREESNCDDKLGFSKLTARNLCCSSQRFH